jgi:DeoR/GlpR family transcriptional regulator of sugar metabolism
MFDTDIQQFDIDERRNKILEMLEKKGKIKVAEMSRIFGISEVTIRLDLTELENRGLLERVHGGAMVTGKAYYNMSLNEREKTNKEEKQRIALTAASLIQDGDAVLINSGTTSLYTVRQIKNKKNITILTNSAVIAQEAGLGNDVNVILLGGNFNSRYSFSYGEDANSQLVKYKADKLILSADGVSYESGITTYHFQEAEIDRKMVERVNRTIVVADYTKIGRESFAYICPIQSIDCLITNTDANENEINGIKAAGTEVYLV